MTATRGPAVAWSWSAALRGVVLAVPATVAAVHDLQTGAALAVGLLPVAPLPLAPTRRGRVRAGLFGVFAAVSIMLGGVLAQWPPVAIAGIMAIAVLAARLATSRPEAMVILVLGLPLYGVGLSYPGLSSVAGLAVLIVAGSAYAVLISLLWPTREATARESAAPLSRALLVRYGWLAGLAGAVCAGIGFALDLEHVGWATAAALLVMRPERPVQGMRSLDRLLDVVLGAVLAIIVVGWSPPAGIGALVVGLMAVVATATGGSRWYVLPFFTTFFVILLLLAHDPGDAQARFAERLVETALGVAVAAVFGLLVPAALDRHTPTLSA